LIPTKDGKRCAAVEVLLGTKTIEDIILRGEFENIKEIMEKSENLGMRTFDSALFHLYKEGRISLDEAAKNADSANNLRLRIKLDQSGASAPGITAPEDEEAPAAEDDKSMSGGSGLTLSLEEIDTEEDNPFPDL
jgi:twitching motility protein PilU